jgi:hypothetical protein
LVFKLIDILQNTLLATFKKLLETEGARSGEYFFLFPSLNSIMEDARFADVAAIQERVKAVLRLIPKEAFADSFQKLYKR